MTHPSLKNFVPALTLLLSFALPLWAGPAAKTSAQPDPRITNALKEATDSINAGRDQDGLKWFAKAVDLGCPQAATTIGMLYQVGDRDRIQPDLSLARQWYEKAVQMGDPDAKDHLASILRKASSSTPVPMPPAPSPTVPVQTVPAPAASLQAETLGVKGPNPSVRKAMREFHQAYSQMDDKRIIASLKKAAALGSPEAALLLSDFYKTGEFGAKDFVLSSQYAQLAARGGFTAPITDDQKNRFETKVSTLRYDPSRNEADYQKSLLILDRSNSTENNDDGFAKKRMLIQQAAELGNPGAQEDMGDSVSFFYKDQAVTWYEASALNGNPVAAIKLGKLYEDQWTGHKDLGQARKWYQFAGDLGDLDGETAAQALANGPAPSVAAAPSSQTVLAFEKAKDHWYSLGNSNDGNDFRTSLSEIEAFAKDGYAPAAIMMGNIYLYGYYQIKADASLATQWYKQAALLGDKDLQKHLESVRQKTHQDNFIAREKMDQETQEKREAKDFKDFLRSAKKGNVFSQAVVGGRYYTGLGVERDVQQAKFWSLKANAKGGHLGNAILRLIHQDEVAAANKTKQDAEDQRWKEQAAGLAQQQREEAENDKRRIRNFDFSTHSTNSDKTDGFDQNAADESARKNRADEENRENRQKAGMDPP